MPGCTQQQLIRRAHVPGCGEPDSSLLTSLVKLQAAGGLLCSQFILAKTAAVGLSPSCQALSTSRHVSAAAGRGWEPPGSCKAHACRFCST